MESDSLGALDKRNAGPTVYNGESPTWHLERPSTAERMKELNANSGFVAAERTLTSVLRGFHYRGDRAEVRRGWHVSDEWTRKYVPELPWKSKGEKPFDPQVDIENLRKKKLDKLEARNEGQILAQVKEVDHQDYEDDAKSLISDIDEQPDGCIDEQGDTAQVDEDIPSDDRGMDAEKTADDKTLNWSAGNQREWYDVTGQPMLVHDAYGRLREPHRRPHTAQSFTSQETDHQHDNLLTFLVDDRYFKGKEPMKSKRTIKDSILHQSQNKTRKKKSTKLRKTNTAPGDLSRAKLTNEGRQKLSDERRRMEQNRILRQVTEEEFQRETERRMMMSTVANPQKRLMLHRYFEEQREIAAKKIETLVRAQEHQMLTDMKLTSGPDLRGSNFEKVSKPPDYFTNIKI